MFKRCIFLSIVSLMLVTSTAYADGGGSSEDRARSSASDRGMAKRTTFGQAGSQDTTEAVAHFARSRALIIAALHEFDKGRKIASPSELLDPVEWRNTLIDRAEDLDRVLDPQPRATKGGIKFQADPRLLPEASK